MTLKSGKGKVREIKRFEPGKELHFIQRTARSRVPATREGVLQPTEWLFRFGMRHRTLVTSLVSALLLLFPLFKSSAQALPQRLVSTAPSETEALFAMGLGARVVGVSKYCEWPAEVKNLPRVGSYVSPDLEAIVRLRPDVVYLEHSSNGQQERLQALGIKAVAVPHGSLAETYAGIGVMAQAAGAPERGEALIARMRSSLAAIAARSAGKAPVRVVLVVDRRPGLLADIVAAGPGNYLNELLEAAGGVNVLAKPGIPPYPRISLETILRENPDAVIDLTDSHETDSAHVAARAADAVLWSHETSLKAVREGRVTVADSTEFVVPGPRSVAAAEKFYTYLHAGQAKAQTR